MSAINEFLFFDRATGDLIYTKRSRDIDFSFDCDVFFTRKVKPDAAPQVSSKPHGLTVRKVQIALWLRTILNLISSGIEKDFSAESLNEIAIEPSHKAIFMELMTDEKRLLDEKVAFVRKRFEDAILKAKTLEELEAQSLLMRRSIQIGIYSPIERERRKIYGWY